MNMSNIVGNEAIKLVTNSFIPGTELIVLKGLRTLTTLIEMKWFSSRASPTQPRITTIKSSYIEGD